MSGISKIAFAGSGNVATHLAKVMAEAGLDLVGFYSRNKASAEKLAHIYHSPYGSYNELKTCNADSIIVAVPDHAMEAVLEQIPVCSSLLLHTSGSLEMNALQHSSPRIGVFYPLQTFSAAKLVDFSQIPILVEANSDEDTSMLTELAGRLTSQVYHINSHQRKKIHIAAIFSSNFVNYLFHVAEDLLEKENVPFEVLRPLIEETTEKIKELRPFHAQTGPAVRNDLETIKIHLKDLEKMPEYRKIYQLLSQQIIKSRNQ
jgi:predicted short-subunit dehydrogenase-like oxidoreductase (DUF2520 family)